MKQTDTGDWDAELLGKLDDLIDGNLRMTELLARLTALLAPSVQRFPRAAEGFQASPSDL
jgi:hypothetical protein